MATLNIMQTVNAVRNATLNARAATNIDGLSTEVCKGRWRIVMVSFKKNGASIVDPLSDWQSSAEAIETLNHIAADKGFRS